MLCALIMAGGKGTRFWPLSTDEKPKQFLKLLGNYTMIQMTVNRIRSIIPPKYIFICTIEKYVDLINKQLPDIPNENIIIEPEGRNTAPSITLSSLIINRRYKDSTMVVLPSDHLIRKEDKFRNILIDCDMFLKKNPNVLLTLGMKPDRPETGYGYIKYSKEFNQYKKVIKFTEKPDINEANEYLKEGDYLWNGGMFIWKSSTLIKEIKRYVPNIYEQLKDISCADDFQIIEIINRNYKNIEAISIDYALLEKTDELYVLPTEIGWDDIGTWKAVERYKKKDSNNNIIEGNVSVIESKSNIAINNMKRLIMIGIKDVITLETKDKIYFVNKDYIDNLKEYRNLIKIDEEGKKMRVSIFGLGYVGCVSAGCLANKGHNVIGVDVNDHKVQLINEGKPTIIEKDIDGLIKNGHNSGLLSATTDTDYAVNNTDISIIAVGTPSSKEGHLNLKYIYGVAEQIGQALKAKKSFHVVAIRSTVLPGTNEKVGKIIEQASGKNRGIDFSIISNPEFLREGTAVNDYFNPPITLIGYDDDKAKEMMLELYKSIPGEKICTDIKVCEIMKYINNTFHALKIVFGNEVGNICKELGIDSHKVMEIFCKDTHLNISPYYFKPGFAYGGSCLPKDTKALRTLVSDLYIKAPVIESIEYSNEMQKQRAYEMIYGKGKRNIGILGLSFKAGTDDLRCSPMVDVVERLVGKGMNILIYDKNVKISELTGTNKDFIQKKIPHLQKLVTDDLDAVICDSDVIVIANKEKEFIEMLKKYPNKIVLDLVRISKDIDYEGYYEGLSWKVDNVNQREISENQYTMAY